MVSKYINGPYTIGLMSHLKEKFENTVIMDYHNKSKNVVKGFYSNAIPNARNTCKAIIQDILMDKIRDNVWKELAYGDMVFDVRSIGLIEI